MKWMSVREFLRGGYRDVTEPTVVSNHGRPVFTVFPTEGWDRAKAHTVTQANMKEWGDTWDTPLGDVKITHVSLDRNGE